jgi:hypothetical protein
LTFPLPAALLAQGYALRPEIDADIPFLMRLYASTREQELAPVVDWSAEQTQIFLASPFQAQRQHYRTHFAECAFDIMAACRSGGFISTRARRACTSSTLRCCQNGAAKVSAPRSSRR